jgi:hypothetical protein
VLSRLRCRGRTVELGALQHLNLAHADVLQGEDGLAGVLNVGLERLRQQVLGDELAQVALLHGGRDDLNHLLADGADLGRLSVGRLLRLALRLLGEGDGEHTQHVAVGRLDVDNALNQRLPPDRVRETQQTDAMRNRAIQPMRLSTNI